jgi:rhodanese-related sulfurtransferase
MKLSIPLLFLLFIFCFESSGQTVDSVKYKSLEPDNFHLAWQKTDKAMLIDVREFFEYKKTRIKGARNIPSSGNLDFAADTLRKDLSLFFYCTTGYRSKRVSAKFAEKGFANIFNLEGGIKAWKEDGFPVERKKLKR